jgi:hypothetical protein
MLMAVTAPSEMTAVAVAAVPPNGAAMVTAGAAL